MLSMNDLRTNIIHLVTNIDDVEKLTIIYKSIEAINKATLPKTFLSKKQLLNLQDGKVQIRKNVIFEDLIFENSVNTKKPLMQIAPEAFLFYKINSYSLKNYTFAGSFRE